MTEASEVGLRLRQWRESIGVRSREAMAARLDVPEGIYPAGTYKNHETGKTLPNATHLKRLAELGCDLTWLVTGRRSTPTSSGVPYTGHTGFDIDTIGPAGLVEIPHYTSVFSAGTGSPENDTPPRTIFLPHDFIRETIGRPARTLLFAEIRGNSMSPSLRDGDYIAMDHSDRELSNDRIYGLSIDGELLVKRVQRLISGAVRFSSDNPDYPDREEISPDSNIEARVIGQVVWHGGALR